MDTEYVSRHRDGLLKALPEVSGYIGTFRSINKRWEGAITAGMIETGRMDAEAGRLFGPLIQDMGSTKAKYSEIQGQLVDAILFEMVKKVVFEITDAAKFAINILKRNLFERTADVGYFATDADIVKLLKNVDREGDDADLYSEADRIRERLAAYQAEYTVYDEIIILDRNNIVRGNFDASNHITHSEDPLLEATQHVNLHDAAEADKFIETFRSSDLRPGRGNVLIYSQKIEDPDTQKSLGTLCLVFDFDDEMEGIFKDLSQGGSSIVVGILDSAGTVISSNAHDVLPLQSMVAVDTKSPFRFMVFNGRQYIVSTVATDGYQGFYGLTWYGVAMIAVDIAFKHGAGDAGMLDTDLEDCRGSGNLLAIKNESDELLADMKLDSINGQVKAARFQADGFVEVLRFVNMVGDEIDGLFSAAITNLQCTVTASKLDDVRFRAFQGNNIADRNLYERANDVCWWALTPLFRELLAKHAGQGLSEGEKAALHANLQYINDLYTPYLRLVLADTNGVVVAVSNPPEELEEDFVQEGLPKGQAFVGSQLDARLVQKAMGLKSTKDYCVSDFSPTALYGGRSTYIYSTAVRHPENDAQVVGVLQIIFDAAPQFMAMLQDVLPKDESKNIVEGSFGIFADREKRIISSTASQYPVGTKLPLADNLFAYQHGQRNSTVVELEGISYALGIQVSDGYREYKNGDGYDNDIVCMIFVPN